MGFHVAYSRHMLPADWPDLGDEQLLDARIAELLAGTFTEDGQISTTAPGIATSWVCVTVSLIIHILDCSQ